MFSCTKNSSSNPAFSNCTDPFVKYKLPSNMSSIFSSLDSFSSPGINIHSYSNNGLSESINIVADQSGIYNKDWRIQCDTFRDYELDFYMYKSSLYGFAFKLVKGYYNFPSDLSTISVINDGLPFKPVNSDSTYWAVYAPNPMIRWMKDNDSSTKCSGVAHDPNWNFHFTNYPNSVTNIGSMMVRNKLYNNVFKFRNDDRIQSGIQGAVDYLWVDKNYGLIQFQTSDSTIWSFEF